MKGLSSKSLSDSRFPAQQLSTLQEWDDLVLHENTMKQVRSLEAWLKHRHILLNEWGLARKVKPGYRVLFHGPSGTGKTLTASLLGKTAGKEVYQVDLAQVATKFIGETEKNLAHLFEKAESHDWILFFDEADALFGKRTEVKAAHDRYAHTETASLLQRIEAYKGLVIFSSHIKSNLDDAFIRRLQAVIHFPSPAREERYRLWRKTVPEGVNLDDQVQLERLADQYTLTGAQVVNVVQHACLQAIVRGEAVLLEQDLLEGVQAELAKEGKLPDEEVKL